MDNVNKFKDKSIGNREIFKLYKDGNYNDMVELIDELKERYRSNGLNSEHVWDDFLSFLELIKFDGILYPDYIDEVFNGINDIYNERKYS